MKLRIATALALMASVSAASAQEDCGLCAKEVVMTSAMAKCFLEQYQMLEIANGAAVVVDLSTCPSTGVTERGVVEALPSAQATAPQPELEFILARSQLACLKEKLQDPALKLDPSATIKLDACNGQATGKTN
jgi:hypothetical protein